MTTKTLCFPHFAYQRNYQRGKEYIFDTLRKKYVRLTPEEWVRQHVINYLTQHLGYPAGLIRVEGALPLSSAQEVRHRADLLVYNRQQALVMLVECKAPDQKLAGDVLRQMMRYNTHKVPFLLFTNGIQHFCFVVNSKEKDYNLLKKMPLFTSLQQYLSYGPTL